MTPDSSARKLPDILISKRTGDKRETLGKRRSKLVDKQFQNLKASNDLAAPKEVMTPQIKAYQKSNLGQVMSKIGLLIGVDTGDNLVKLIQPSESDQNSQAEPLKAKNTTATA